MEYAALAVILFALAIALYGLFLRNRPRGGELPKETARPVSPLAKLVWAAHVASEKHDLAILTGNPAELGETLNDLVFKTDQLSEYLTRLKDESDA